MSTKLKDKSPKIRVDSHKKSYSYTQKWCEDCQASHLSECSDHRLLSIADESIRPRAFATLPHQLTISKINPDAVTNGNEMPNKRKKDGGRIPNAYGGRLFQLFQDGNDDDGVGEDDVGGDDDGVRGADDDGIRDDGYKGFLQDGSTQRGVFAREIIPARTQFGPMVCNYMTEGITAPQSFHLLMDDNDDKTYQLDLSDVDTCNWMMFVRPASSSSNQNLVAFQHHQSIFYVSTKNIEAGQELRVWYARPYAERLGVKVFSEMMKQEPDASNSNDDESCHHDDELYCESSEQSYPIIELLEEQVTSHDLDSHSKEVGSRKGRRRLAERKTNLNKERDCRNEDCGDDDDDAIKFEMEEEITCANDDDDDYHPKNLKKNYWSKLRRYKRKRTKPPISSYNNKFNKTKDVSSKTIATNNNREWSCHKCDLIFDDSSILNLHILVHAAENADSVVDGDKEGLGNSWNVLCSPGSNSLGDTNENHLMSLMTLTCPVCNQDFETKTSLVAHVSQHGSSRQSLVRSRPFKCQLCLKTFGLFERLQQHLLCHGDESLKPLACEMCSRRFMNPAALAVHAKTHSDRKYYACPLCQESFHQIQLLRTHARERHLERTIIKTFDPVPEVGGGRNELVSFVEAPNSHDGLVAGSTSALSSDGSCAAVAMATATTAITSGVWVDDVGNGTAAMTTEGMEFVGDENHCLFAEEVTTGTDRVPGDNDLRNILELNASIVNSGNSKITGDETKSSRVEGTYLCPECHRVFAEFSAVSRHIRLFHSGRSFECKDCGRTFPRRDKLRLHALRHSNHREFVCETCGRQFKRKDKLRDHLRRQHDPTKECDVSMSTSRKKNPDVPSFTPEISPLDFMKFVFKCQKCLIGFKRRGMLVNHLAKKHPDVPVESIPELNLPILISKHDFFCQYCNKVFKSSSKRKFHILKHHPGFELPASLRPCKRRALQESISSKNIVASNVSKANASFSAPCGHLASEPYFCNMCHRQYSSKSKLVQHQRKKHAALEGKVSITNKQTDAETELDDATRSLRIPSNSIDIPATTSSLDYSELFVGAPMFFAPKVTNSLDMSGDNDLTTSGSVLVLSNENELLTQGSAQLNFAKTPNFAAQSMQVNYTKPQQQHQTVIIDSDVFAQAVSELTKNYSAKNSVILARYDAQQHHFTQNNSGSDMISLSFDNGTQQQDGAQFIQVTPGTRTIVTSPYISVVEYEQLCSIAPQLS